MTEIGDSPWKKGQVQGYMLVPPTLQGLPQGMGLNQDKIWLKL